MKKKPTKKTPVNPDAVPAWAKGPYRGISYQREVGSIEGRKRLLTYLLGISQANKSAGAVWHALFSELYDKVDKQEKAMK
jgi:hypothetical protein